jgi:hypothetical protein
MALLALFKVKVPLAPELGREVGLLARIVPPWTVVVPL